MFGRHARHHLGGLNIFGDQRTNSNNSAMTDLHPSHYDCIMGNSGILFWRNLVSRFIEWVAWCQMAKG